MAQERYSYSGAVDADGNLEITFGPGSRTVQWVVSQVSVEMTTAPAGATCALREGIQLVTPLVPTGDTASGEPAIVLRGGDTLTATWAGCTEGDTGRVYVIYDESRTLT